jgi:hypothetical protein
MWGVGKKTSSLAIWGGSGRTPLVVRFVKQITDYLNRLTKFENGSSNELVRHAFAEQKKARSSLVQDCGLFAKDT